MKKKYGLIFISLLSLLLLITGCEQQNGEITYKPHGSKSVRGHYIVGIHPYLNSKKTFELYQPILDYMEEMIPGIQFDLETSQDYAQYDEKLYIGHFHFSLPNPYQTVNSFRHGYHAIAKMKPDSVFRGIFVARKDRHLTSFEQLRGSTVSFPAPTALAATMMPKYYLWKNGMHVHREIEEKFVGSQFSSIMNAYTGDALVAATWPPPWEQWQRENPEMAEEMELVWQTEPLVNNGFVVRHDVDRSITQKVRQFLINLDHTERGRALLAKAGFDGFEAADNDTFGVVVDFLKTYDETIGLPQ